jgi:hypothetical protein
MSAHMCVYGCGIGLIYIFSLCGRGGVFILYTKNFSQPANLTLCTVISVLTSVAHEA